MSSTQRSPSQSKTGTCKATFSIGGDIYAVPHSTHSKKKVPSQTKTTNYTTSYDSQYKPPLYSSTGGGKKLEPYHPDASRNRNPIKFKNESAPYTRFCNSRNVSQLEIGDNKKNEKNRFSTTHKSTFTDKTGHMVGNQNPGIVAEKTQWMRKRMED
eukprot:gb/GECH01007976.1/.p1 GENE.gb/GECH01007976.1/~~gb/GECH01007976.1/.p1  ORF type:complete len:156 (+),score=23.08 gb/GECH01007976.1/:1-468(+)